MRTLTPLALAAALVLTTTSTAWAAPRADVDVLTGQAAHVIEGRVEAVTEVRLGRDATLHKDYRVRIHRVLHGDVTEGTRIIVRERAEVSTPPARKRSRRARGAGADDDAPAAQLVAGQRVLLFVGPRAGRRGTAALVRGSEGAWLIDHTTGADAMAYRLLPGATSARPDPKMGVSLATLAARVEAAKAR